jgi:PA domain
MNNKTFLAAGLLAAALATPASAAKMILNNVDVPGVGFNDPTPAAPVGGNAGATVGEQRLIAYRKALELWGKVLKSDVTIVVQGSFARLDCDATGGVLAQAGANQIFFNFPNAPLANHWYGVALANALAGEDLAPGGPDPGPDAEPFADDIVANFNGDVGKADCIAGPGWYYGLDNKAPDGQVDFLDTFMHEVSHGLGFQNFASEATGATPEGLPDVYMANTLDLTNGLRWNGFSAEQILASAVRTGKVVWAGPHVTNNAKLVLGPFEGVRVSGALERELEYGTADFGAPPSAATFGGTVVRAEDGVADPAIAGTITDGCEAITTNVAGKIALIDRGGCGFVVKVKNAQNAGASAVIIANTLGRGTQGMGGTDATITIASILISNADADAIRAALPTVQAAYFVDPSRLAGTAGGYVRLYAPGTVAPGSSISHFDTAAAPNLLMEPFITDDLRSARNLDLTPSLMRDIGLGIESLKIGRCDTHVPNALANGDMLHVKVEQCQASARNRGQFVACTAKFAIDAFKKRLVDGWGLGSIVGCAARQH